jgi:hypothetical protein
MKLLQFYSHWEHVAKINNKSSICFYFNLGVPEHLESYNCFELKTAGGHKDALDFQGSKKI